MKAHTLQDVPHPRSGPPVRVLGAILGAISGMASLAVRIALLGDVPATTRYEDLNRMWFGALALMPVAVLLLYLALRHGASGAGHAGAVAAIVGSAAAAAGNAIEFQYGKSRGFILFGLGSVIFALGMLTFGLNLRRRSPDRLAAATAAIGPLGFLTTIAGPIGIAAAVMFSAAWVMVAFGRSRG